jgi:exodeoxyribonuclease V alpha subunit
MTILDESQAVNKKMSILSGKMQRLYLGSEYEVTATLSYNQKYKSYQYTPSIISAITPKTYEQQKKFLESIVTEKQAQTLLAEYPNIVEDVINKTDDIDLSRLHGIGEFTWGNIKDKILNNYVISDILILLQPLGVSYNMIKKLLSGEPNPSLLKEKLLDNPYIMTKIHGLGFKKVDALALKLNPDLRVSEKRTFAFIKYYFHEIGNTVGHTWVELNILENAVRDNINECLEVYKNIINHESNFPMILWIDGNRVGLKSYYDLELNILQILKELNKYNNLNDLDVELGIKESEKELGFRLTEEQKEVVANAVKDNVVLISGRAGTGKSTIAKAILKTYTLAGKSIAACALSAKAAQRITEATGYPASTIHRLLASDGHGFKYNYNNPLPYDVILIDECSMINAEIFYHLLSAIREGSKVIMCGDNRQLPPIGYGNIFSDLLNMCETFNVNQLTKVLRQAEKSGILSDANKIREGIYPIGQAELKIVNGELQDMIYMFRDNRESLQNIAVKTYLKSIEQESTDDVVIIVPRKKDCANSTFELNKLIQNALIPSEDKSLQYGKKIFKLGAKVIQRENNYDKNVFNGEIGYITKIWDEQHGKEKVSKFEVEYKLNDSIKQVQYSRSELEQIDLAYALTVHLAQGSGYKTVISIIDNTHYTLLDTCLLYTALTRAKKRCLLLAEPKAFRDCLSNNKSLTRQTWLSQIA